MLDLIINYYILCKMGFEYHSHHNQNLCKQLKWQKKNSLILHIWPDFYIDFLKKFLEGAAGLILLNIFIEFI